MEQNQYLNPEQYQAVLSYYGGNIPPNIVNLIANYNQLTSGSNTNNTSYPTLPTPPNNTPGTPTGYAQYDPMVFKGYEPSYYEGNKSFYSPSGGGFNYPAYVSDQSTNPNSPNYKNPGDTANNTSDLSRMLNNPYSQKLYNPLLNNTPSTPHPFEGFDPKTLMPGYTGDPQNPKNSVGYSPLTPGTPGSLGGAGGNMDPGLTRLTEPNLNSRKPGLSQSWGGWDNNAANGNANFTYFSKFQ